MNRTADVVVGWTATVLLSAGITIAIVEKYAGMCIIGSCIF